MYQETTNPSKEPIEFDNAQHTNFNVGDVRQVTIYGLTGTEYLDKNLAKERIRDDQKPLQLTGPTDRVYLNTVATCTIHDPVLRRHVIVAKDNSHSAVVWNPWQHKIGSMADLSADEWHRFLCVETCNVEDDSVKLPAGGTHALRATITSERA